jgi:hypothetical protein
VSKGFHARFGVAQDLGAPSAAVPVSGLRNYRGTSGGATPEKNRFLKDGIYGEKGRIIETSEKVFFYYSDGGIFCNLQIFSPQKAQKTQRNFSLFCAFCALCGRNYSLGLFRGL